jgi:DNA-binding winged helix-turn-helix (wHTH) protein/tetratricopeptide (TPR) repeat protein
MGTPPLFFFPPFRLDVGDEQLWRGVQAIELRPKTFAVLRYLVEHPGRLVTKEEVLNAVWPQTVVSEWVLKSCIRELREALGDEARTPRYIETVHRRGYRFIAAVDRGQHSVVSSQTLANGNGQPTTPLVGREADLAQLHEWLEKALGGARQIVFVTGEPGIGKTTLVEKFLFGVRSHEKFGGKEKKEWQDAIGKTQQTNIRVSSPTPNSELSPTRGVWVAVGQCIEHYGAGEAYLPVLEALERLCQESGSERLVKLLDQYAPTWLVHMPWLLSTGDLEALQRKVLGATPERMLREMAKVLEALTAERPLVLVLEDLHWSDPSTLDLLSLVARRTEPARLLILGTYRPLDVIVREHPLKTVKHELQLHDYCQELALEPLSEMQVAEYLAMRCLVGARRAVPRQLARLIHQRTEGNPLFVVSVVDDLIARGMILQTDTGWELKEDAATIESRIPDSIRQLVTLQSGRLLPAEQQTLEAASIAGMEFSAASVAAALTTDTAVVERLCEHLAERQHFLRRVGIEAWPDGTLAARYSFLHALYQQVWHERVSPTQLQHYHLHVGERKEQAYDERAREIAVELAIHFEQGRDYSKAVQYLQQAGGNAVQRSAHVEAIGHLTKGLEVLKTLPDTPQRAQHELTLQVALGAPLMATKGYAAPVVEKTYARARKLCQEVGETPQIFRVLGGLSTFYVVRGELQAARKLGEQLLQLAQNVPDPILLLRANFALGPTLFFLGEFAPARKHLEQGIALYTSQKHRPHAFLQDPGVGCLTYLAWALWFLGYPDQALKRTQEAITLAHELAHPHSLAFTLNLAARVHHLRGETQAAQEQAEAAITLSSEQGFLLWLALGSLTRGWALAEQGQGEGIAQIRQGLAAWQATGAELLGPYHLALLAEACGQAGQVREGLTMLAKAQGIVGKNGGCEFEAELYRLHGELTLQKFQVQGSKFQVRQSPKSKVQGPKSSKTNSQLLTPKSQEEAEGCFLKAIEIARQQQARSLELRAVMSLVRLRQHQAQNHESRNTDHATRTTQHEARTRLHEAHTMLSDIYNWFTEGFDTQDLKDARALLDVLV